MSFGWAGNETPCLDGNTQDKHSAFGPGGASGTWRCSQTSEVGWHRGHRENKLYKRLKQAKLWPTIEIYMRNSVYLLVLILTLALTGCAGPERKFGRGMNNFTEIVRMGEIRRSVEQTALWEGPEASYTVGVVRGINRTVTRTAIGAYELVTAPFPPYGPLLTSTNRLYPDYSIRNSSFPWGGMVLPEDPVFPDNYRPTLMSDSLFSTDTSLGFSGGDVAPMVPGSRFHIFDNY